LICPSDGWVVLYYSHSYGIYGTSAVTVGWLGQGRMIGWLAGWRVGGLVGLSYGGKSYNDRLEEEEEREGGRRAVLPLLRLVGTTMIPYIC